MAGDTGAAEVPGETRVGDTSDRQNALRDRQNALTDRQNALTDRTLCTAGYALRVALW